LSSDLQHLTSGQAFKQGLEKMTLSSDRPAESDIWCRFMQDLEKVALSNDLQNLALIGFQSKLGEGDSVQWPSESHLCIEFQLEIGEGACVQCLTESDIRQRIQSEFGVGGYTRLSAESVFGEDFKYNLGKLFLSRTYRI
jgi:hypothetical protein